MKPNKIEMSSVDGTRLNLEALYQIAPSCFTEVKDEKTGELRHVVNFKTLRQLLGDNAVEDDEEMYQFTWPGKQEARREAARPTTKTLRPVVEDSVDWDNTQNLYIEGDNLEVLKLLQKSYMGKVKMIYIDPPYNTGNDFVYDDDFAVSKDDYDVSAGNMDELGNRYRKNTDSNGRFHSDWCSMIYSRLLIARSLLKEDGVIFMSIDENEVSNLRSIADEVFNERNFIAELVWAAGRKNDSKHISISHEYILAYFKNADYIQEHKIIWREKKQGLNDIYSQYEKLKKQYGEDYVSIESELKKWYKGLPANHPAKDHAHYNKVDEKGIYFADNISWPGGGGPKYEVLHPITHKPVTIPSRGWITSEENMKEWIKQGRVAFAETENGVPTLKAYLKEREYAVPYSVFYQDGRAASKRLAKLMDGKVFENPKDEEIIQRLIEISASEDGDIVLDFFSGSGTTAHSMFLADVNQKNKRKFILVQLEEIIDERNATSEKSKKVARNAISLLDSLGRPHTIPEIAKERIRRAGKLIKNDVLDKLSTELESLKAQLALVEPDSGRTSEELENKIKALEEKITPLESLDTGFRVFRLADSNFEEVKKAPGEYDQSQLDLFLNNVKSDRTDLDLLFGAMLSWGVQLSLPMTSEKVDGKMIYSVNDGDLVACFAEDITENIVKAMADKQPLRVLFRDSCFARDDAKINVFETLKQLLDWSEEEAMKNIKVI